MHEVLYMVVYLFSPLLIKTYPSIIYTDKSAHPCTNWWIFTNWTSWTKKENGTHNQKPLCLLLSPPPWQWHSPDFSATEQCCLPLDPIQTCIHNTHTLTQYTAFVAGFFCSALNSRDLPHRVCSYSMLILIAVYFSICGYNPIYVHSTVDRVTS